MRSFLVKGIALLVCLHGLAWHSVDQKRGPVTPQTGAELIQAFSPNMKLTYEKNRWDKAPVTDLYVSKKVMQFRLDGLLMRVEWIGEKSRFIKFNGRIFAQKDFRNFRTFEKAFRAKFGIMKKRRKQFSLMSLFVGTAHAEDGLDVLFDAPSEGPADATVETEEPEDDDRLENPYGQFESEEDFNNFVNGDSVVPQGSLLSTTSYSRQMQVRGQLSEDYLLSLMRFAGRFTGLVGMGMSPAGGFVPGMSLISGSLSGPSSVPSPHW